MQPKGQNTQKFYVTLTWDNWPEGGSFGTVVMAEDHDKAIALAKLEMAHARLDGYYESEAEVEADAQAMLAVLGREWHVVDCFALNELLDNHRPLPPSHVRMTQAPAHRFRACLLNPNPEFIVDGFDFDDPDSMQSSDGAFPPFRIFHSASQNYIPGEYQVRAEAEAIAALLNERPDYP